MHWAATAQEACDIVVRLCKQAGAKSVARSKSMLGEEIGLPHALAEAGIDRVETDLAEHIIQLSNERPSHIIWPAMHKTREQVSALFKASHRDPHTEETIAAMAESARRHLREGMLAADVGISGANFLVADTGAVCTVTNEGNAELSLVPPRVHIVTAGIEKLVPSMAHATHLLRLLARTLGLPRTDVDLALGATQRHKVVQIAGDAAVLLPKLTEALRPWLEEA